MQYAIFPVLFKPQFKLDRLSSHRTKRKYILAILTLFTQKVLKPLPSLFLFFDSALVAFTNLGPSRVCLSITPDPQFSAVFDNRSGFFPMVFP